MQLLDLKITQGTCTKNLFQSWFVLWGMPLWRMDVCMVLLLCFSYVALLTGSEEATRNYYDALSVEPTASDRQIKKAFRSLALKHHPDKDKSAEAEEAFREIAEAYKVLSNKADRKLYDQLGHNAFVQNGVSSDPQEERGTSFDDIFHFFEDNPFDEEPYFMQSFPDDNFHDHYTFHAPKFTYVFSDGDEYEEDYYYF